MARIAGINIPDNKRIDIALTYVYGVGQSLSKRILKEAGIDSGKKTSQLSDDELNKLRKIIEDIKTLDISSEDKEKFLGLNLKELFRVVTV